MNDMCNYYDQYGSFQIKNIDEFKSFIYKISSLEYAKEIINSHQSNKLIHFCFCDIDFLFKEENSLYQQCIASWIILLNDKGYNFINWNYNNIEIFNSNFCNQVRKYKYNVALADYVRWRALYDYGGWYLDADVMMVKSIDELSKDIKYIIPYERFNYEYKDNRPETAIIYSQPKLELFKEIYRYYDILNFMNINQLQMFIKTKPSPHRINEILNIKGYKTCTVVDIEKYKEIVNNSPDKTIQLLSPLYLGNTIRTNEERLQKICLPTPYTYAYHLFRTHWAYNKLT